MSGPDFLTFTLLRHPERIPAQILHLTQQMAASEDATATEQLFDLLQACLLTGQEELVQQALQLADDAGLRAPLDNLAKASATNCFLRDPVWRQDVRVALFAIPINFIVSPAQDRIFSARLPGAEVRELADALTELSQEQVILCSYLFDPHELGDWTLATLLRATQSLVPDGLWPPGVARPVLPAPHRISQTMAGGTLYQATRVLLGATLARGGPAFFERPELGDAIDRSFADMSALLTLALQATRAELSSPSNVIDGVRHLMLFAPALYAATEVSRLIRERRLDPAELRANIRALPFDPPVVIAPQYPGGREAASVWAVVVRLAAADAAVPPLLCEHLPLPVELDVQDVMRLIGVLLGQLALGAVSVEDRPGTSAPRPRAP